MVRCACTGESRAGVEEGDAVSQRQPDLVGVLFVGERFIDSPVPGIPPSCEHRDSPTPGGRGGLGGTLASWIDTNWHRQGALSWEAFIGQARRVGQPQPVAKASSVGVGGRVISPTKLRSLFACGLLVPLGNLGRLGRGKSRGSMSWLPRGWAGRSQGGASTPALSRAPMRFLGL